MDWTPVLTLTEDDKKRIPEGSRLYHLGISVPGQPSGTTPAPSVPPPLPTSQARSMPPPQPASLPALGTLQQADGLPMIVDAALRILGLTMPISKWTLEQARLAQREVWRPEKFEGNPDLLAYAQARVLEIEAAHDVLFMLDHFHLPITEEEAAANPLPEKVRGLKAEAEAGSVKAQYELGCGYLRGISDENFRINANEAEAVRWFRKAAEQGHAPSQVRMGLCYIDGAGVKASNKIAIEWFSKAAAQGDTYAQYKLDKLRMKG